MRMKMIALTTTLRSPPPSHLQLLTLLQPLECHLMWPRARGTSLWWAAARHASCTAWCPSRSRNAPNAVASSSTLTDLRTAPFEAPDYLNGQLNSTRLDSKPPHWFFFRILLWFDSPFPLYFYDDLCLDPQVANAPGRSHGVDWWKNWETDTLNTMWRSSFHDCSWSFDFFLLWHSYISSLFSPLFIKIFSPADWEVNGDEYQLRHAVLSFRIHSLDFPNNQCSCSLMASWS